MDATTELGRNPVSTRFSLSMEMSRLTRVGTAETVSQDQILMHVRGQGNIRSPVQLITSRIGNLSRLIHTLLYVMTIHAYIHTGCRVDGFWFQDGIAVVKILYFCKPLIIAQKGAF